MVRFSTNLWKNLKSIANEWDQKRQKKESLVVQSLILSKTFSLFISLLKSC